MDSLPHRIFTREARDVRDLMSTAFKTIMGTDKVKDVKYLSGAALLQTGLLCELQWTTFHHKKVTDMTLYFIAYGNTNLMNLGERLSTQINLEAIFRHSKGVP